MTLEPVNNELKNWRMYAQRLCDNKVELNLTWQEIAHLVNSFFGVTYSEKYYRSHYRDGTLFVKSNLDDEQIIIPGCEDVFEYDQETTLKKERMKLSDERVQNNAILRRISREETIKELGIEAANIVAQKCPMCISEAPKSDKKVEKVGILQLSDWHYGIVIDTIYNQYNPEIAKNRVSQLVSKVKEVIKKEGISYLYVFNLGDMIAGNIHLTIRLNSRINVLNQIMEVSEIISEAIASLSTCVNGIEYYAALDNHSRIDPIRENSLDLESLCRITTWYMKERLKWQHNVIIHTTNKYGPDIITTSIWDHEVAAVHGHKDKPEKVVDNLVLMTKHNFDLILTSHFHHFQADEKNEVLVLCNSSLMGTDDYAQKLRLSAKPSQNFIVATRENVAEQIYRIVLN